MNRTGYAFYSRYRFSVRGSMPETVLNACAAKGIELREAEYSQPHSMTVWVYEKDLADFKKTAEECMCFLDEEEAAGGRNVLGFFRRHLTLLLFCAFFAACLLVSSLFIWDIKVVGNEKLTDGEIKRALRECGICPGCYWPGIDNDMVRAEMLIKLPELAWMSVNVNGSRAAVPVLERKPSCEIYNENGNSDLLAKCGGTVEKVCARNGKALVSRGQTVEKGSLLISGSLDSMYGEPRYVRSLGEVYARTWREYTALCPEISYEKIKGTKSHRRYALIIGDKRINFYSDRKNTVDEYDKIIHNNKLGIKGIFIFPVAIVAEEYVPYTRFETADGNADYMRENIEAILKNDVDGEILSSGFVSATEKGLKKVTVRCECLENIAEEKKR